MTRPKTSYSVFYEVWRHKDRYERSRSLEAWVLGIANKRAIDHVRRRRRAAIPVEELYGMVGEDGRELAERYVQASEVRDAVSRLPDEQREVLRLAYFGDCTQTRSPPSWEFLSERSRHARFGGCAAMLQWSGAVGRPSTLLNLGVSQRAAH
jgi:hypothetical protein